MKNNDFEFGLTLGGQIVGTSFQQIEKLIVPYFKDLEKKNFHDDGYGNIDLENKHWEINIILSQILIYDVEEDYLLSVGFKGSFEEGEKALKEFAAYLDENDFVYSLEYEGTDDKEYLIEHPHWNSFFEERKQKSYPEYEEKQRRREQARQYMTAHNNRSFWQKVKDFFNQR